MESKHLGLSLILLLLLRPLCSATAGGVDPDWVPAEMAGRIMLVNATVNGKGPVRLILDTGATETILTWGAAVHLGLVPINAGGVSAPTPVRTLGVGKTILKNQLVIFMDPLQALTLRLDKGIDYQGLLGYPFLKNFKITLDYRRNRVRLEYPPAPGARDNPHSCATSEGRGVPLQLHDSCLYAQGKVNGQGPLTFLVDTGSSEVLLMPRVAANLGLRQLQSGNAPEIKWTRLESVALGDAVISNVITVIYDFNRDTQHNRPYDGIIGQPFLSRFLATIDYHDKRLILKPYDDKKE